MQIARYWHHAATLSNPLNRYNHFWVSRESFSDNRGRVQYDRRWLLKSVAMTSACSLINLAGELPLVALHTPQLGDGTIKFPPSSKVKAEEIDESSCDTTEITIANWDNMLLESFVRDFFHLLLLQKRRRRFMHIYLAHLCRALNNIFTS